jgi:hypothetical protein
MPYEIELTSSPADALAAFIAAELETGGEVRVLVADDRALPALAAALDPQLRPLCLILPRAEFAAGTARRASLALLASRLRRDIDDSPSRAWTLVRDRCRSVFPDGFAAAPEVRDEGRLAALFPALVTSRPELIGGLGAPSTLVLLDTDAPLGLEHGDCAVLRLHTAPPAPLSHAVAMSRDSAALLFERMRLTQDIADLELELASVQAELARFRNTYYRQVGRLMAELDTLQAAAAAARAAADPGAPDLQSLAEQAARQAGASAAESVAPGPGAAAAAAPNAELRRQFRRLAQQIHPDRAEDDADHALRTRLMSEANLAYRAGDSRRLGEIAAEWQQLRHATPDDDPRPLVERQLQRLRDRLLAIEAELHGIFGSPLYQLFIAARQAGRAGRDLLAEMAANLERAIEGMRRSR